MNSFKLFCLLKLTMKSKNKIFNILKIIIVLLSVSFLAHKLMNFEYWSEFKKSFNSFTLQRILLLVGIILLMPFNWFIEVIKWQKITEKTFPLNFLTALKSVLLGITTGYITPNRIGEFAGRILYLPMEKRAVGTLLSFINGLTQNTTIMLLGGISTIFYFTKYNYHSANYLLFVYITLIIIICIIFYFYFPYLMQKIKKKNFWKKKTLKQIIEAVSLFQSKDLLIILFWSAVRFVIFNIQFFLLLYFFGIDLTFTQAIISIPTMYLLITFTPSFAFSEPAIRGAYSVFVLGIFSTNHIGIILTGITLWLINFVIPLLFGIFLTTIQKDLS